MRSPTDVQRVFDLAESGLQQTDIAALVGVGQTTVSRWLRAGEDAVSSSPMRLRHPGSSGCPSACPLRLRAPPGAYSYLLGQYLGDGSIAHTRRGVYRLFVSCCAEYPDIIGEVKWAVGSVAPHNAIGERSRNGAVDVTSYSKHWPCLFPQHGPGRKHTRRIALEPWQELIVLELHPQLLLRGLIHSDGCRCINRVSRGGRTYAYPRYMFSNRSDDIRQLFVDACHRLGIESRRTNRWTIAVSRQASVARVDEFVGPKS